MSLPHALLGLLNYRPATGYELKATFTKSIHFFWNATLPQIYRTLKQMEGSGWLNVTVEHQDGRPSRKVYHITDAGKKELRRWLNEPLEMPEPRNAMMIRTFFGNQINLDQFIAQLQKWQEYHGSLLKRYEKEITPVIDRYAKMTGAFRDARYWNLTLDFGRRYTKMVLDWCEAALSSLNQTEKVRGRRPLQKGSSFQQKRSRR
jgi:DNA-binding PadR family transcriptional regulator